MPRHTTHTVTLPAAAAQAAHEFDDDKFDDKFDFSTTNAHGPPSDVPPMDDLPEGAMVPDEIPPGGLPTEAVDNMADMATDVLEELREDVPWWLDHVAPATVQQAAHDLGDQLDFSPTIAHGPPATVPPVDELPEQAAEHVPDNIPPQELPEQASETAVAHFPEHVPVPWLIDN